MSKTLELTQKFFYHLVFDSELPNNLAKASLPWITPEIQEQLSIHSPHRQQIYRELVMRTVREVLHQAAPVFFKYLDDANDDLIRRFLSEQKIQTNYYRELPCEFQKFLGTQSNDFLTRSRLLELAVFELDDYALRMNPNWSTQNPDATDLALEDAVITLNPDLILRRYTYDVTCIDESHNVPMQGQMTYVLQYRHADSGDLHVQTLTDLEQRFLQHRLDHPRKPLGQLLADTCQNENESLNTLDFIRALMRQKVILGLGKAAFEFTFCLP